MPRRLYYPDKTCAVCGVTFNRKRRPSGLLEEKNEYAGRKYCSPECYGRFVYQTSAVPIIECLERLQPVQWAYLAGIFDGEGSVTLRNSYSRKGKTSTYSLSVTVVCGCHGEAIAKINSLVGTKTLEKINDKGNKRPAWRVRLHSKQALRFLEGVRPFLLMKVEQTDLAIEFERAKPARGRHRHNEAQVRYEQACKDRLTLLNQRGVRQNSGQ